MGKAEPPGLQTVRRMKVRPFLGHCRLCPRACGADRTRGETGFCGAGALPRVFRWGPHFGEEPPLVGENGSGAIFFSRCTMRCIYCQNSPWSWGGEGEDMPVERLTEIMRSLAVEEKCANWNLVSPTPWLPLIRAAAAPLISADIRLPFVYNTSGFESAETLDAFPDLCDIALCDLRYSRGATALEASAAPGYVEASRAAVKRFWNRLGPLETDSSGVARRGTLCRILVLPGHADEAVENLAWLAANVSASVHVSVMAQYTPSFRAKGVAPWNATVSEEEYAEVAEAAADFGFENGWVQDFESNRPSDLLGERMSPGAGPAGAKNARDARGTEKE